MLSCGRGAVTAPRIFAVVRLWVGFVLLAAASRAHTPDTSYARVDIGSAEVVITFTYDLATLARVTTLDRNADQSISRAELLAAAPGLEAFIRRTIYFELNEREAAYGPMASPTWPPDAGDTINAAEYNQRLVALTFRNSVLHAPDSVALTFDFFQVLGDRHTVLGNFLWNKTENPVVFTRFEPDYLFDTGYQVPAWEQFQQYVSVGTSHIFLGYDHIAFLIALLFVKRFVDLLKVITAFTVAHTLTLALAALGIVTLPGRFVESAIAASIIYVAAENLWRGAGGAHRWQITFAFGLVHGFGFASVLRELGLPATGLVRSLLAFNVGVELGQLAIAALGWPLLRWIDRRRWGRHFRRVVSWLLLAFGAAWLADRALAFGLMPF